MAAPKPVAKSDKDGYIRVAIADNPGCIARTEAWLRKAAAYALTAGLGFLAGVWYRSIW